MPRIKAPSNLPELVRAVFNKARASGDITYYPTQVAILPANSIPVCASPARLLSMASLTLPFLCQQFQLRFSPSLAHKPKPPPQTSDRDKPYDPFDNPTPALLVAPLPPAHVLVLNRFAVVPEHFILATAAFAPQTHLLEAADLEAAYACVEAYEQDEEAGNVAGSAVNQSPGRDNDRNNKDSAFRGGGGVAQRRRNQLFAFFNSGSHSGASQPHRHIQLLPVERMRDGLDAAEGHGTEGQWDVLAERLLDGDGAARTLPFAVFAERLGPGMDGPALRRVYLALYGRACAAVDAEKATSGADGRTEAKSKDAGQGEDGEARISYNMAMTRDVMVLCPRAAEGAAVTDAQGKEVGAISLNGTVLAGTALVKNEAEWDALRNDPTQLVKVLGQIGLTTA